MNAKLAYSDGTREKSQRPVLAEHTIPPETKKFYKRALVEIKKTRIPFVVGGAFALMYYTDVRRMTKDLDIFVRLQDLQKVLAAYAAAGFQVEIPERDWLAKAWMGTDFVDIIFASRNRISKVDEKWFSRAPEAEVLGLSVKLCPIEEMIYTKALVMERERYDGADVAHLLLTCAEAIDWKHLLERFGACWRVLLTHLILFGFVYPSEAALIPAWVMEELLERLKKELNDVPPGERVCRGSLISGSQYTVDISRLGFKDLNPLIQ